MRLGTYLAMLDTAGGQSPAGKKAHSPQAAPQGTFEAVGDKIRAKKVSPVTGL